MSATKNATSPVTSAVLFLNVKGEPMRFFIRPGLTKVQLQPLITNGGGVLCRTQEPSAFLLADPGDINAAAEGAGHFYISTQYVRDCVAQNQQLDIESYRFNKVHPVQTRATSRKQRSSGRMGYSLEDDTAIVNFISKHKTDVKGNRIWQQMERQRITDHSWQSMKDRFLKHLQHKLEQKSPESKKRASLLKESSSSEDNIPQPKPKRTPRKKVPTTFSSDSDEMQLGSKREGGTTEQEQPPEEITSPEDSASEKKQTGEVRKETDGGDESVPVEEKPDMEQTEVLPKRPRMDTETNDQSSTLSKKQNTHKSSGRKLGILERAAREFEDSQVTDGSEDQPLSQTSSINTSDTDEVQIMAARERALKKQAVNPDTEDPAPAAQNHGGSPGPEDDDPGPSSAVLPVTSNAHMFLFQQESQEQLSQSSKEDQPPQILLETKQHVVKLMQEFGKDLVEVMKVLLKASGDVNLARSYLLEGYNPEVHGPIWTQHDDKMLLSADSVECDRLDKKYGAEKVSKRAAFLKTGL